MTAATPSTGSGADSDAFLERGRIRDDLLHHLGALAGLELDLLPVLRLLDEERVADGDHFQRLHVGHGDGLAISGGLAELVIGGRDRLALDWPRPPRARRGAAASTAGTSTLVARIN